MTRAALYLAVMCSACVAADDSSVTVTSQEMISLNGTSLTGVTFLGTTPSGGALNSSTLLGVSTSGNAQTGAAITTGPSTAPPWTGAALVGSTWSAVSTNNVMVKLRVDSAQVGSAPNTELWAYGVSYQTTSGWQPLCGLDAANQPIKAVTVGGAWGAVTGDTASYATNANRFTLACRTKTVAKCLELGYKPYKGYIGQMVACVRMLRADYCGTGVAHTVDGTSLNIYDNVGIQLDTAAWAPEAEWTASGARCVNSNNALRYEMVRAKDPGCTKPQQSATCGTTFANGALIIDELAN